MKTKPPKKQMLLQLSKMLWSLRTSPTYQAQMELRSWEYLIAWGFYEMYVEGWWQE